MITINALALVAMLIYGGVCNRSRQRSRQRSTSVPQAFHQRSTSVPQAFHQRSASVPPAFYQRPYQHHMRVMPSSRCASAAARVTQSPRFRALRTFRREAPITSVGHAPQPRRRLHAALSPVDAPQARPSDHDHLRDRLLDAGRAANRTHQLHPPRTPSPLHPQSCRQLRACWPTLQPLQPL